MVAEQSKSINDLIFKELIKRGYSLEGNTRIWNIADSKLWYLKSDQAQAFLDLEGSEEYQKQVIQKEIDLLKDNMAVISKEIEDESVNIVDLGCGDGKKALLFINKLKGKSRIRYCPIDISDYMVEKALSNIRDTDVEEVVKFQWNISDFENIENVSNLLRFGDFKKNFFLLLGNTLGNFEINELLYEIRSSMKGGDYLLIGNGLDNMDEEEIMKSYDNDHLNNLLFRTVKQLGLKKNQIKYGARFNNSRVEMYYTLLEDVEINFLDKTLKFEEGDQIIVAVSYKYTKKDFFGFLNLYFDEVDTWVSEDKSYAVALCKK
jgi:uncharacterized SAM-dependent methyltransferase